MELTMFKSIKEYWNRYREKRFLRRHSCSNWREYNRRYDTDFNNRATEINSIYHGYSHVYQFTDHKHTIYDWDLGYDGAYVVERWCEQNLCGKFRLDFHRVIEDSCGKWVINELGGGDYIFAAFKDPQDFTHFMLRWS
jgi:hypothetical protein